MEGIIEGLLYVQGDLGLTINQIEDILEIPEEEAKRLDEDAGLGCAIWGLILIFSIIGSSILTYIINN